MRTDEILLEKNLNPAWHKRNAQSIFSAIIWILSKKNSEAKTFGKEKKFTCKEIQGNPTSK